MRILLLSLGVLFSSELQVQGNLKVTGTVDANGNPITNVGEPVLTTDVATASYVNSRTASKGRIITIKCPWLTSNEISQCEPPECPPGWDEIITFNEIASVGVGGGGNNNSSGTNFDRRIAGNTVRYCMEQEDE